MTPKDLITIIVLIFGLVWGTIMFVIWRRSKTKPETWPHFFGIGIGVYMLVSSMTASILLRPRSELVDYIITNFILSLAVGLIGYFSGRKIARDAKNRKK
jgi:hypothetical protein